MSLRCDGTCSYSRTTNVMEVRITDSQDPIFVSTFRDRTHSNQGSQQHNELLHNQCANAPFIPNNKEVAMKSSSLRWLVAVTLTMAVPADAMAVIPSDAMGVRENNGGNCIGTKSCRPRCITFRVDREPQQCDSSVGIFSVESDLNPWDVSQFNTFNCEASSSCVNDLCGEDLTQDLTVRIGEFGDSGSQYYSSVYMPKDGDERFTYCSVYPCPNDECAVPEQMVSETVGMSLLCI